MLRFSFGLRPWCRLFLLSLLVAGCGDSPGDGGPVQHVCEEPTDLLPLHEAWAHGDASCRDWVERVRGRLVHNASGSAVVWTPDTPSGVGLVVGAFHVLGTGWFRSYLNVDTGEDVPESLRAPAPDEYGVMRLRLPPVDGSWGRTTLSGLWMLYNPQIPAAEHEDVRQVKPRSDFFVGITDGKRVVEDLVGAPSHLLELPADVQLYDPEGLTGLDVLVTEAEPDARVLLAGYPQAGPELGAMSVGRVLGDDDAEHAISRLAAAGDEEGDIPYDARLEFLVEGRAEPGMSGGGVFDRDGRLLGVMVRASTADIDVQYVRALRITWIAEQLEAFASSLDGAARAEVEGYLPFDD